MEGASVIIIVTVPANTSSAILCVLEIVTYILSFSYHSDPGVGTVMISTLKMRKLRHEEAE